MTPHDPVTGIVTDAGISISLRVSQQTSRRSATRLVVARDRQPAHRRCLRYPRIIREREFSRRRNASRLRLVPSLIRVRAQAPAVVPPLHREKVSVLKVTASPFGDNLSVVSQTAVTVPSLRAKTRQLAVRKHRKATARTAGPVSRTTSLNPTSTCWPGCHSRNRLCHRMRLRHRTQLSHPMRMSITARHTHFLHQCLNIRVLFTSIRVRFMSMPVHRWYTGILVTVIRTASRATACPRMLCIRGTSIVVTGSLFRHRGVTALALGRDMASVPVSAVVVAAVVVVLAQVRFDREWNTIPVCERCV